MNEEDKGKASIKMSGAFLKPEDEKDHYGLYRKILVDRWDETKGATVRVESDVHVGPLMIFRRRRGKEPCEMRTIDPRTQREIELVKVWDLRQGGEIKVDA